MKKIIVPIAILALVIFVACNNDNVAPIEEPAVEEVVEPAVKVAPEVPEVREDTINE